MDTETPAYGLWTLVILNTAVFVLFALSFARVTGDLSACSRRFWWRCLRRCTVFR
jgi:hypothetical protein